MNQHISGAILYDETIRQSTKAGVPFTKVMLDAGILPGIKVDKGPQPLAGFPGEVVTEGLDGLRERLNEYARLGAKFAKWRAVITIGEDMPSGTCIEANCHALARYAALCQEAGIVPMVEPEMLMDGDHDLEVCYDVTEATLRSLFGSLYEQNVMLEGTILKASMVVSGKSCRGSGERRRSRRSDGALPESIGAGAVAGHRVSIRRPDRRRCDRAPQCDEPDGSASVAAVVLVRSRDAAGRAASVGERHEGQLRRCAENRRAARARERSGRARSVAESGVKFFRQRIERSRPRAGFVV